MSVVSAVFWSSSVHGIQGTEHISVSIHAFCSGSACRMLLSSLAGSAYFPSALLKSSLLWIPIPCKLYWVQSPNCFTPAIWFAAFKLLKLLRLCSALPWVYEKFPLWKEHLYPQVHPFCCDLISAETFCDHFAYGYFVQPPTCKASQPQAYYKCRHCLLLGKETCWLPCPRHQISVSSDSVNLWN